MTSREQMKADLFALRYGTVMIWDDPTPNRRPSPEMAARMHEWLTDMLDRQRERLDTGRLNWGRISVSRPLR